MSAIKKWTESKAKQVKTILIIHHSWYPRKQKCKGSFKKYVRWEGARGSLKSRQKRPVGGGS